MALVVRLLPPDRREWGWAMSAELAALETAPARRQHALGCLRVAITSRVLIGGAGAGIAGALLWLTVAIVVPPVPTGVGTALAATALAMVTAATITTGSRGGAVAARLAALCAGTLTLLLIFAEVALLAHHGPAWLIPVSSTTGGLATARAELDDPYVAMLFLACVLAVGLSMVSTKAQHPEESLPAGLDIVPGCR